MSEKRKPLVAIRDDIDYENEPMLNDGVFSGYITSNVVPFGQCSVGFTMRWFERWTDKQGEAREKEHDFNVEAHADRADYLMDNARKGSYLAFRKRNKALSKQSIGGKMGYYQSMQVNEILYLKNDKGNGNG